MKASEVRRRILDDHAELRGMLRELAVLSKRFEEHHAEAGKALRERGLELYARLEAHIGFEDSVLPPVLRSTGPAGDKLAERLAHEHKQQRELITFLGGRLGDASEPPEQIARELRIFAGYLALDMAYEEETMLTQRSLRDDVTPSRGAQETETRNRPRTATVGSDGSS